MNWLKRNKWKLLVPILLAALLAAAFWCGGGTPDMRGREDGAAHRVEQTPPAAVQSDTPQSSETELPETGMAVAEMKTAEEAPQAAPIVAEAEPAGEPAKTASKDALAEQAPAEPPVAEPAQELEPVQEPEAAEEDVPEEPATQQTAHMCAISISCATLLEQAELLDAAKRELVPEDGWILPRTEVAFEPGESVFDVLLRACRDAEIHMEFTNTPLYGGVYLEGIANLYEFDAGALSGWVYSVNGWFPNYGCSGYMLADGDEISWFYTCDLGADVGGSNLEG